MIRIANDELNISLKLTSIWWQDVSTHYVNLAYEIEIEETLNLPSEQHNEYQRLTIDELLGSKQVHKHVKDYFKN